jgi:DNA repair ATPase RecN
VPAGLRLENYVVIDNVGVEFTSGLALLTGKTGGGKVEGKTDGMGRAR